AGLRYTAFHDAARGQRARDAVQRNGSAAKRLDSVPRNDLQPLDLRQFVNQRFRQTVRQIAELASGAMVVEVEYRQAGGGHPTGGAGGRCVSAPNLTDPPDPECDGGERYGDDECQRDRPRPSTSEQRAPLAPAAVVFDRC